MISEEQKADIISLRDNGLTLQEIGDKFGVSRQRVCQLVPHAKIKKDLMRTNCYYSNLAKWITVNKLTNKQAGDLFGFSTNTVIELLKGKRNICKNHIDSILKATGLTYEQAFYINLQDEN